jgi:hypothetical protein
MTVKLFQHIKVFLLLKYVYDLNHKRVYNRIMANNFVINIDQLLYGNAERVITFPI